MSDRGALIAVLQHEARLSGAYRAARRRNAWHAAGWGIVVALALGLWGYVRSTTPESAWSRAIAYSIVFACLWAILAAVTLSPPGFYRMVDRIIQRRIERGFVDCDAGPQVLTLVDEGIVCEGSWAGDRLALWSEVERIVPEEDAVYFDLLSGSVFRVPRTAFRGDEEFSAVH